MPCHNERVSELLRRPLKTFLVELALAWAGREHGLELGGSGQWKLPKMRYKGNEIKLQRLRLQRNEPVSCLKRCMMNKADNMLCWLSAGLGSGSALQQYRDSSWMCIG